MTEHFTGDTMRTAIILLIISLVTLSIQAQDTIFIKNGRAIPAIIVEKNDVEIKYKRPGQPESPAIYLVFVSDILKIRYSDGIIADYTTQVNTSNEAKPKPVDLAGTMRAINFSTGLSYEHFSRKPSDDLLIFWRNKLVNPMASIFSNPISVPVNLRVTGTLGKSGRNLIGDELQFIFTPADAINASSDNGSNEIRLKSFYYNITLFYGHTINHKNTIAAIVEPGLDISEMSGYIKLNNNKYVLDLNNGTGFHLATGANWMITKRFLATLRAGYRFMKIKESHEDKNSPSGFSYFYVIPGVNENQLSVKWNGPYVALGLSWCMYIRFPL